MDQTVPSTRSDNDSSLSITLTPCQDDLVWPIFLASSAAFPLFVLGLLGLWHGGKGLLRACRHRSYDSVGRSNETPTASTCIQAEEDRASWEGRLKCWCRKSVSGQVMGGKILVLLEFIAGMTALIVYLHQVTWRSSSMESCDSWYGRIDWQVELGCNMYLLLVFVMRFVAANDKIWFLVDIHSIVDYCTIPPAILPLILHRSWIGLRCFRAWHLLDIPEILQFFNVLKTRAAIRLAQLTCQLLAVLLVASGLFHLLESTSGRTDFANDSGQNLSYWEFVYFSIVTLSTVGYGDISPKTTIGRLFCCLFIISALALFASAIPEVFVIVSNRKKHSGLYKAEKGTGHVVITGHLDLTSVAKITREFDRHDRLCNDIKLVFVDLTEPDIEMESYLKRNAATTKFLQGSLVRVEDLRRAKLHEALACLIVTDKNSAQPERDDSSAIMIVTSVKNFSPSTRCIVQVLQTKSKNMLVNIPTFSVKRGDAAICFQELELALIAQSCMSPGCGTLLQNLMCSPAYDLDSHTLGADPLIRQYIEGCHMEVYLESFSPFFIGMTFCEAAGFCKKRLDLLLIGLFKPMRDNTSGPGLILCPTSMNIPSDRVGVFVAPCEKDVSRARDYCADCHADVTELYAVAICHCVELELRKCPGRARYRNPFDRLLSITNSSDFGRIKHSVILKPPSGWEKKIMMHVQDNLTPQYGHKRDEESFPLSPFIPLFRQTNNPQRDYEIIKMDITANFYWCPSRSFHSVALDRSAAALRPFKNHIIVLVMARPNDPPIGLRELVVPLRSSRIPYDDLNEVVFLGHPAFLEREWADLYNLPKITMIKGDPLSRADLRAVSVRHCTMCVVLSAWTGTSTDPILDDKAAILAALNIKAMPFEETVEARDQRPSVSSPKLPFRVPVTIELQHNVNVRLLDETDLTESTSQENPLLMESFLSGETVTFGTLSSLLVTSFRNPLAVPIMQQLLFGFKSPILENLLAEGVGFVGGEDYTPEGVCPYGTRIKLLSVMEGPWKLPAGITNLSYSTLFEVAAQVGMICLGIGRRFGPHSPKRCVLTNPSRNFILQSDDLCYVLAH